MKAEMDSTQDAARARLDEIGRHAKHARSRISSGLIAVSDRLQTPYSDKPELTPWTYAVRPPLLMVRGSLGDDVPALLAAVTAALDLHRPEPLYGECGHTDTPDDGGPASHAWEAGDGVYVCGDPTGMVCSECCDDDGSRIDFPCATYRDVAAAIGVTA